MKTLNRRFSRIETILLLIFSIIAIGILYYFTVIKPVEMGLVQAQSEKEGIQIELDALSSKYMTLTNMQNNLYEIQNSTKSFGRVESYNNSKNEINFINDALVKTTAYTVNFDQVTRQGDLIRRVAVIQYKVPTYQQARKVLSKLCNCPYRSLATDIAVNADAQTEDLLNGEVVVNVNLTFFETLVGGKADSGLPQDEGFYDQQDVDQAREDAISRGDEITNMTGIQ